MATGEPQSFDDFDPVEDSDDNDDGGWIDLEPGDEVIGTITDFRPCASYNGVVEIDGRPYRLNASMRRTICRALVEGREIAVRKSEDTATYTDDDGVEHEYNPREVRCR